MTTLILNKGRDSFYVGRRGTPRLDILRTYKEQRRRNHERSFLLRLFNKYNTSSTKTNFTNLRLDIEEFFWALFDTFDEFIQLDLTLNFRSKHSFVTRL